MVQNLPAMWETWVWSLDPENSLVKAMQPSPVFLPGEFHGQRSLAGYSPWDDRVGQDWPTNTHTHTHTHTCTHIHIHTPSQKSPPSSLTSTRGTRKPQKHKVAQTISPTSVAARPLPWLIPMTKWGGLFLTGKGGMKSLSWNYGWIGSGNVGNELFIHHSHIQWWPRKIVVKKNLLHGWR